MVYTYIYIYIDTFFILIHPLRCKGFGCITPRYLAILFQGRRSDPLRRNGFKMYRSLLIPSGATLTT